MKKGRFSKILSCFLVLAMLSFAASFTFAAGEAQEDQYEFTVTRDDYGVPNVYAEDMESLFYGFGFVVAEDRLFQLEMSRRSVWGTVSEVLGEDFIDFDIQTRQGGFSRAEIEERIDALDEEYQRILDSYAAGINEHLGEALDNPQELLPKEFQRLEFEPEPWTAADVANIFIGTMATRYSDFTAELGQAALLAHLQETYGEEEGKEMFNDVRWVEDPEALTTIPREEEWKVEEEGDLSGALPQNADAIWAHAERQQQEYEQDLGELGFPVELGSNAWVFGGELTPGGEAILLGGPQMGWTLPGYLHEVGLHGPDFSIIGTTTPGYPAILFGHNEEIAWTSTAGLGNVVDIFVEELDPEDPTRYKFEDEWHDMEIREETIPVRDGEDVTTEFYRTVHGPVIQVDEEAGEAYAKGRSWEGLELESLAGWIDGTFASDWEEFKDAARKMAITITWLYADRDGNIGYLFCGRYPDRHPDQDPRLPTPGTGEREWQGYIPFEEVPHVFNPEAGYLANWNQQPAEGWSNPALMLWGKADRAHILFDWIEEQETLTVEDAKKLNKHASFADVNEQYFRQELVEAVRELAGNDERLLEAADLLEEWDGYRSNSLEEGYYDSPGQAIFEYWLTQMLKDTFEEWFGEHFGRLAYEYPRGPMAGSINVPGGAKVLLHVLEGEDAAVAMSQDYLEGLTPEEAMKESLTGALGTLSGEQGEDMEAWKVPVTVQKFGTNNFAGVPQGFQEPPEILYQNRGTQNHIVVLDEEGVRGENVNPPGQSGFVSLAEEKSLHFNDQMELYENFNYKTMGVMPLEFVEPKHVQMWINETGYEVDGEASVMDVAPFIENDYTYVPVRFLAESFGFDVGWSAHPETGMVSEITLEREDLLITMHIGEYEMTVLDKAAEDYKTFELPVAPQIVDGRTFLPARVMGELAFDLEVGFETDPDTELVEIVYFQR